ncbi:MAG: signal peptidase I [Actinomycetia bacterium]|nr:signal peptidase I [Actinomycetes bacterium]
MVIARQFASALAWVWTAFIVALLVVVVVAKAGGWQFDAVRTASMTPTVPRDSLAVITGVDVADVATGDIVTFKTNSGAVVMHRVVEVIEHNGVLRFRTQGDFNDDPDPGLTHGDAIEGQMRWAVPRLGAVALSLRAPWGLIWLVAVPAPLLMFAWWPRRLDADRAVRVVGA